MRASVAGAAEGRVGTAVGIRGAETHWRHRTLWQWLLTNISLVTLVKAPTGYAPSDVDSLSSMKAKAAAAVIHSALPRQTSLVDSHN
jgi:hypothetical protein